MAENLERNIFAVCKDLTKHGKSLDIVYDIRVTMVDGLHM